MERYYPLLQQGALFGGFSTEELHTLLATLAPVQRSYAKGETLLLAGYQSRDIGIVLAGEIEAAKHTAAGGLFTVSHMGPGGIFGDVLAAGVVKSPVTVTAAAPCQVLLIPAARLFASMPGKQDLSRRLLGNLVRVMSEKYFMLDARVDLLLIKGLRRRVAALLLAEAGRAGSPAFTIPFTRAGLAAYLGCERSALSREISRMAAAGLLETRGKHFRLLNEDGLRAL